MAKRKRLAPPTADELAELEAGFAPKPQLGAMAPIAQVAAEAAAQSSPLAVEDRAALAQDQADAAAFRKAVADGAIVQSLPLDLIDADQMTRDRLALVPEELAELVQSIKQHGVRLPIEVYALRDVDAAGRFGLVSGFRRLMACRQALAETGAAQFAEIPTIVREPAGLGEAFTAMVEENEIRSGLSHYERGRIAALAAHQGAFATIDDAVAALFFAASKAKRSKVRSFAMIHEELGDLLNYPQNLTERMGLRLAGALRSGFGADIRAGLANAEIADPEGEWRLIERWIHEAEEDQNAKRRRGGRRAAGRAPKALQKETFVLGQGRQLETSFDGREYVLRLTGAGVSDAFGKSIAQLILANEPK